MIITVLCAGMVVTFEKKFYYMGAICAFSLPISHLSMYGAPNLNNNYNYILNAHHTHRPFNSSTAEI